MPSTVSSINEPAPISLENADQVGERLRLGKGVLEEVVWSGDGRTLVAIGAFHVELYDAINFPEPPRKVDGFTQPLAINTDGSRIASMTVNGDLMLWDSATGDAIAPLAAGNHQIIAVEFSPDDQFVAALDSNSSVFLWNVEEDSLSSPSSTYDLGIANAYTIKFRSTDVGGLLAVAPEDEHFILMDVFTGQILLSTEDQPFGTIGRFSPDGSLYLQSVTERTPDDFFIFGGYDAYDTLTGNLIYTVQNDFGIDIAIGPDNTTVVTAPNELVETYDLPSGSRLGILTLLDTPTSVRGLVFNPDGTQLAASTSYGRVLIIDVGAKTTIATLGGFSPELMSGNMAADGRTIVTGTPDGYAIWDTSLPNPEPELIIPRSDIFVSDFALHPLENTVAIVKNGIQLWDIDNHTQITTDRFFSQVNYLSYSADGTLLATSDFGGPSHNVRIRHIADENAEDIRVSTGVEDFITAFAFSPDGSTFALVYGSSTVAAWDVATGEELFSLAVDELYGLSIAFSPDSQTLAVVQPNNNQILMLNVRSGDIEDTILLLRSATFGLGDITFSADGSIVALVDEFDILLIEAGTNNVIKRLSGHRNYISSLKLSKDGRYLISTALDGTIRLWGTG